MASLCADAYNDDCACAMGPSVSSSPSSVAELFPGAPPCGAPAMPMVRDLDAYDDGSIAGRAERIIRASVKGVLSVSIRDTTDAEHIRQGARDGRALSADGCQLQVHVSATSFRGAKPIARHRMVMSCLKDMIDSGAIHSVQVKATAPSAASLA